MVVGGTWGGGGGGGRGDECTCYAVKRTGQTKWWLGGGGGGMKDLECTQAKTPCAYFAMLS